MKKGFSLVELMVVMGLLAVTTILGISGMVAYSNATIVDKASEEVLTTIRDAQNRSIAVTNDENANTLPYVWGVKINASTNTFKEINVIGGGITDEKTFSTGNIDLLKKATFKVYEVDTAGVKTGYNNDLYLYFSAPYARYYVSENSCNAAGLCSWVPSNTRPKDYVPSTKLTNTGILIEVTYRNNTRSIEINPSGDSHVQ